MMKFIRLDTPIQEGYPDTKNVAWVNTQEIVSIVWRAQAKTTEIRTTDGQCFETKRLPAELMDKAVGAW